MKRGHLLTQKQLKARGWTPALIECHFPAPTERRTNPFYQCAAPMKLYDPAEVERIEASEAFRVDREKASRRQDAAARAVRTKEARMADRLANLEIDVPELPSEELIRRACDHYNARRGEGCEDFTASPGDDPAFLQRICVNFLRHALSRYEQELEATRGRVAARGAYYEIKEAVLQEIGFVYPWLEAECKRQRDRAWREWLKS